MGTTLEINIKVEVEDGKLTSLASLAVNGEVIGSVSRLRVDVESGLVLPSVEVDMLKGIQLDNLSADSRARAQHDFDLLKQVPGVVARMPAPRNS
jgi:hypothetical protein